MDPTDIRLVREYSKHLISINSATPIFVQWRTKQLYNVKWCDWISQALQLWASVVKKKSTYWV